MHVIFGGGKMARTFISCPVCGSDNFKTIIKPKNLIDDPKILYGASNGIKGTQTIVKCLICSMKYENPRLTDTEIIRGYMSSNDETHDSQYEMRVGSFLKAIKRNRKYLPQKGSSVLDIGTAGGAFLVASEQYGWIATGIEPSGDLVHRGKSRGLNISQGDYITSTTKLGKFRLISLWDVIEHVPEPKILLKKIHSDLEDDGVLLINFPNIGTLQAKLAGKSFWWIISVHLHHFTNKTLDQICKEAGFMGISKKRYWQQLEFGYLVQMAAHLKVPFAKQIFASLPKKLKTLPLMYYASQTTAIYRKSI